MANIRVLIVDDSALIRKMLTQVLGNAAGIEVVGGMRSNVASFGELSAPHG